MGKELRVLGWGLGTGHIDRFGSVKGLVNDFVGFIG